MNFWKQDTRFIRAAKITLEKEGVFANDPDDSGGATIYGVASAYHPEWYARIMEAYNDGRIDDAKDIAREFYYEEFWTRCKCQSIKSEMVARELFDAAVNMGIAPAVRCLQSAVTMFRAAKDMAPILVDGKIGPRTVDAVNSLTPRYEDHLVAAQNGFQFMRYREIYQNNPERFDRFIIGWMKRCVVERTE